MTGDTKSRERAARVDRLSAALRENLKRRKAQSKVRASSCQAGTTGQGPEDNAAAGSEGAGKDDRGAGSGNR